MSSWVAFLRAVNVGGRMYKMADLRAALEAAGLGDVETYIQTGNVRFTSPLRSREKVERRLEEVLADGAGFEVPTIALTPGELAAVHDEARSMPSPLPGEPRRYVTFLKEPAPEGAAEALAAWDVDGERVAVRGRAVHWWLTKPTHKARISNARIERQCGLGTTRDLKVVTALAERWGG
jgi:uncharacterized protein (DUF1697 family)